MSQETFHSSISLSQLLAEAGNANLPGGYVQPDAKGAEAGGRRP